MQVTEVINVAPVSVNPAELLGQWIDLPRPGDHTAQRRLEIAGWVLGASQPVIAVELIQGHSVVQRVGLGIIRQDVAGAYPHEPEAGRSGFHARLPIASPGTFEIRVQAVLRDQRRVSMSAFQVRQGLTRAGADEEWPLVSVIIPCFNHARFVSEAIESILEQTYPLVEVVVVDDGSTDNAAEVCGRYPGIKYFRLNHKGVSAARNFGLAHSDGVYVLFLDADDRLLPNAVKQSVAVLTARRDCALAAGRFRLITFGGAAAGESAVFPENADPYTMLLRGNCLGTTGSILYRRGALERVGGFDTTFSPAEDYELYLRMAKAVPIAFHQDVVSEYRRHGASASRNTALMFRRLMSIVRLHRRQLGDDASRREACQAGRRWCCETFGQSLVDRARVLLGARQWTQAARILLVLLQLYPRGAIKAVQSRRGRG